MVEPRCIFQRWLHKNLDLEPENKRSITLCVFAKALTVAHVEHGTNADLRFLYTLHELGKRKHFQLQKNLWRAFEKQLVVMREGKCKSKSLRNREKTILDQSVLSYLPPDVVTRWKAIGYHREAIPQSDHMAVLVIGK